ncbi:hypothetical protein [Pseudomonas sp. RW10S2]|uniref:hypothetical protein n=1 Tax=Pseudomonas sp. RW10S2 TaxID=459637 RepID=UPI0016464416|nr:hypothetical protein [Pseudomonas sp. RW10S2]MBC3465477.1 hypothetical protein [Pseudomonas sp. RW10S2]
MDLRCQFSGRWAVNHEPDAPGTARYHIVLAGHCHVRLPNRQAIVRSTPPLNSHASGKIRRMLCPEFV